MLIGISGEFGSGKDEVANALQKFGYASFGFGNPLKDEVQREVFDAEEMSPILVRNAPAAVLSAIAEVKASPGRSTAAHYKPTSDAVRIVLQWYGTEYRRELFGYDYWVVKADQYIGHLDHIAVKDVRFDNEADYIRSKGGLLVRVKSNRVKASRHRGHVSETGMASKPDSYFDYIINNDGTLDDLASAVEAMVDAKGVRWQISV